MNGALWSTWLRAPGAVGKVRGEFGKETVAACCFDVETIALSNETERRDNLPEVPYFGGTPQPYTDKKGLCRVDSSFLYGCGYRCEGVTKIIAEII
jgi:hypothetical protein